MERILPKNTVIEILNLFPKIESIIDTDERTAIKDYLHGEPTDKQQATVLYICKTIMESCPI
jgi:hypothetical protein